MQTKMTVMTSSDRLVRYDKTLAVEHDDMSAYEGNGTYEGAGGEASPRTYAIAPSCKILSISSTPPGLLDVKLSNEETGHACSAMIIAYPTAEAVSVGVRGELKAMCQISGLTEDGNGNIVIEIVGDDLNYASLTGSRISGPFSLNGEYFYFIFGDYSEQQVYLTEVGEIDEAGIRYEYDSGQNMTGVPITARALEWERTGAVATITHESHGHAQGATVALTMATSENVSAEDVIPASDYTILSVSEDGDSYTVACENPEGGAASGLVTETYTYGKYNYPTAVHVAAAMERCINAMFPNNVVTVDYEDGALIIRSLMADCRYMHVVTDYGGIASIIGFDDNQTLSPAFDVSDYSVYAEGLPVTPIGSATVDTITIPQGEIDIEDVGGKLFIIDHTQEIKLEIVIT